MGWPTLHGMRAPLLVLCLSITLTVARYRIPESTLKSSTYAKWVRLWMTDGVECALIQIPFSCNIHLRTGT
jgi:hypothetical protein